MFYGALPEHRGSRALRASRCSAFVRCDLLALVMANTCGSGPLRRLRRKLPAWSDTSEAFPPLPAVRPADVPDLYLERQREAFCGLHALNAALGGPLFTQEDLDRAAQRVVDCAIAAAMHCGDPCDETLARHRSAAGMCSEQVLGEALAHDGRWRLDGQSWHLPVADALALMPRGDVVGAIAYLPGHWVALRVVDGGLWLLDSLRRWPQRLGGEGDPAAKAFMESCERVFLICSGRLDARSEQEPADDTPGGATAMPEVCPPLPSPPSEAAKADGEHCRLQSPQQRGAPPQPSAAPQAEPRVSRSRSPRRVPTLSDPGLPAHPHDGARGVRTHAEELLQVYASGGDARLFLQRLPLVHPAVTALTPELSLHLSALGLDALAADWWALGILVFEMAVGYPPFFGKNPFTVYKKILECKPPYPSSLPSSTKAVVAGFLTVSRTRRLGWVSANPAAVTSTITTTTTTDLLQALKCIF